jgi:hypothetical protein
MTIDSVTFSTMLAEAGGPSESGIVMMMFSAEPTPSFEAPGNWAKLCEFVTEMDLEHNFSQNDQKRFAISSSSVSMAMDDNDIVGAIAAVKMGLHKAQPLIAMAASNKHEFPGLSNAGQPEIAVMRFLEWAGADVSAPELHAGMTALHYMASTRYGPGSDVRAVRWLLDCGASPAVRNKKGDTPLSYLCGTSVWGEAQRQTFSLLLQAGGDPLTSSNDGTTPLDLLRQNQAVRPTPLRQALIKALEADIARSRTGFFSSLFGVAKDATWEATLTH